MLLDSYPYYLANQSRKPNADLEVTDKYTGEVATRVALADEAAIDEAIARAVDAARPMQDLPAYARQNILQHCADRFSERAEELAQTLCIKDESVFIGPMISEKEAVRLEFWINRAKENGARILCGGQRKGSLLSATLLENVQPDEPVWSQEAFGPVAVLSSFDHFEEALAMVNNSAFGLQAGIFTRDIYKINKAWDTLEVGGIVVGDVPSWRADHMPYGGVKDSGLGREGIRFAMEEMTEIRLMVMRQMPGNI